MSGLTFFRGARWLLSRLLLALLVALAMVVFARQFVDGDTTQTGMEAVSGPRIGRDHWHAVYQVFICGQRQPNFPGWPGGIHTHSDGIIHSHPILPREEGVGARLVKWFVYGGGKLTQTEMRMPGDPRTVGNGDKCPDGSEGVLQVLVNGERLDDWSGYIPQDGDRVLIAFGEEEAD